MIRNTSFCPSEPLFLAPRHRDTLRDILQRYVPEQKVFAFGSRATGQFIGRFSDLDLAVERALLPDIRYDLMEALEDSTLPVKVDFVELDQVDADFANRIRPHLLPIEPALATSNNPH